MASAPLSRYQKDQHCELIVNTSGINYVPLMTITTEQIRAARALLRWEQRHLAEASGVSLPTIKRLEMKPGPLGGYDRTVNAIVGALEGAGVKFLPGGDEGPGVRLKVARS